MHAIVLIEANKSEGTLRFGFDFKVSLALVLALFGL